MDEEIVTLGEVSLTIFTNELFLGSSSSAWASEQSWIIVVVERGTERGWAGEHVSHQQSWAQTGQHGTLVRSWSRAGTGHWGGHTGAAAGIKYFMKMSFKSKLLLTHHDYYHCYLRRGDTGYTGGDLSGSCLGEVRDGDDDDEELSDESEEVLRREEMDEMGENADLSLVCWRSWAC